MTDAELFSMARARTNSKIGFYIHSSVFVIVMLRDEIARIKSGQATHANYERTAVRWWDRHSCPLLIEDGEDLCAISWSVLSSRPLSRL